MRRVHCSMTSAPSGAAPENSLRIDEKSRPATARMLRERDDDRRHDVQHRRSMTRHEIEIRLELEPRHDDERRARPNAHEHDDGQAVDMKERQERDRRVLAVDVVAGDVDLQDVRDEVAVRQHHAFRQPRRAARVRQRDEVVRRDRDPRRSAARRGQRLERDERDGALRGRAAGRVERHDVLDGRAGDRLNPGRGQRRRREQHARGRVLELLREVVLRVHRARGRDDGAQARDREHGDHVLRENWRRKSRRRRPCRRRARPARPPSDRRGRRAPHTKSCGP